MSVEDDMKTLLLTIGLSEQKALETLKNDMLSKNLKEIIEEAIRNGVKLQEVGTLLYHLATKMRVQVSHFIPLMVEYIVSNKIDSQQRIDVGLDYLLSHLKGDFNVKDFETACGVGVIVTPEEVEQVVEKYINKHKNELLEKRYRFNVGGIMQEVRSDLKWADGKAIKHEVDLQVLDLLGPKTESDFLPQVKQKKKTKGGKPASESENLVKKLEQQTVTNGVENCVGVVSISEMMKTKVNFHKPGENYKTDGYIVTPNTMKLLEEHLKLTGGQNLTALRKYLCGEAFYSVESNLYQMCEKHKFYL